MISFIIIGKNVEKTLSTCINSILNFTKTNTITDWEIIYVDSDSVDNTLAIAKKFHIKIIQINGKVNSAIGRNVGADKALGDTLFFLDGDMELLPGFYDFVFTGKNKEPFYPFIVGCHHHIHYDDDFKFLFIKDETLPEKPIKKNVTGGLMIINKNLWDKVKGMDGRLTRNQDIDFGLRMSNMGVPALLVNKYFVNHHTISYYEKNRLKYFFLTDAALSTGILMRKHFLDINYIKYNINNIIYTCYVILILVSLPLSPILSFYLFSGYVLIQALRTIYKKEGYRYLFQSFVFKLIFSFFTLYGFLFYYPASAKFNLRVLQG